MLKRSCEQIFSIFRKAEWPIFSVYVYWFVLSAAIYFHFIWMHNLGDIKGKSTEGTNQISQKLPTSRKREQNSLNTYWTPCSLESVIQCVKQIQTVCLTHYPRFCCALRGRPENVMVLRNREYKKLQKEGGLVATRRC